MVVIIRVSSRERDRQLSSRQLFHGFTHYLSLGYLLCFKYLFLLKKNKELLPKSLRKAALCRHIQHTIDHLSFMASSVLIGDQPLPLFSFDKISLNGPRLVATAGRGDKIIVIPFNTVASLKHNIKSLHFNNFPYIESNCFAPVIRICQRPAA